ncbi:hypothetical protein BGZ57DRAFT_923583 [Hyaloscypha finlandica]|nr:hypothetical protein BGZ57DRAFT_923583 [Hyaloscypha finlandica]
MFDWNMSRRPSHGKSNAFWTPTTRGSNGKVESDLVNTEAPVDGPVMDDEQAWVAPGLTTTQVGETSNRLELNNIAIAILVAAILVVFVVAPLSMLLKR